MPLPKMKSQNDQTPIHVLLQIILPKGLPSLVPLLKRKMRVQVFWGSYQIRVQLLVFQSYRNNLNLL